MSLREWAVYLTLPVILWFTLRNPYWGVLALALYHSVRPEIWGAPGYLRPHFIIVLGTSISLLFFHRRRLPLQFNWTVGLFALLAIWMLINSSNAIVSRQIAWDAAINFVKLAILLFIVTSICTSPKAIRGVYVALILGYVWLSKSVFVQYLFEGRTRVDPLGGESGGGNQLATELCMTLPFLLYLFLEKKGKIRWLSLGLIGIWLFDLVAIGSRGGFLALILVIVLFWAKYQARFKFVALALPIVVIAFAMAPRYFWERMATINDFREDPSAANRLLLWQAGIEMFKDHPLTGVGTRNFQLLSKKHFESDSIPEEGLVAHNSYVELLAENGLIGLLLYLAGMTACWAHIRKAKKLALKMGDIESARLCDALEIALLVFLCRAFTGTNYFSDVSAWFLGMAGGMYAYARAKAAENHAVTGLPEPKPLLSAEH